ncbi:damage-inducible protein DinB [Bacillus sp. M6-12]|uniref:DinB family protein n=1 Tax=Bacillus sp. M6-12 TaxID=2054166 RepID=UPI000C7695A9|nr:DinB family protein [Bacillus sp. M6-12]PLS18235.1 damage-inducible protein DinB [Bacillus sp. M6-12]
MKMMFHYNWMVREEWFKSCEQISEEDLLETRTGGVGGILKTLFHIIDVEWSWIRLLQGESDFQEKFEQFRSLKKVRELDAAFRPEVQEFVNRWEESMENRILHVPRHDGQIAAYSWGEVMRHAAAHEIHHIGQLSVWAREIGKVPVSANLIGRSLSKQQ